MVKHIWDSERAAQLPKGVEELVYRSNLIGSDRTVCNWGGGNTSMKTTEKDFRGREIEVMWVKGSGSDLATMKVHNFSGLKLDDIRPLIKRDQMPDEEMVDYLSHCMIDSKHPRPSIETLLHAFLPYKHVDHTHPDAIISICCADNGKQIAEDIYGNRFVWVPYVRPGFTLSKMIAEGVANNPHAELVLMEKHGLVTWGETSETCYQKTISIIQEAEQYINDRINQHEVFGGKRYQPLPAADVDDMIVYGGVDVDELLKKTTTDRYKLIKEMIEFIDEQGIVEFKSLMDYAMKFKFDDWFPLLCDNSAYVIQEYIKSNRYKSDR